MLFTVSKAKMVKKVQLLANIGVESPVLQKKCNTWFSLNPAGNRVFPNIALNCSYVSGLF